MIQMVGAHNTAICYTGALDETAAAQIQAVCDQEAFSDCKIRIMPDVHAGKGCTIGTTMTISDKVVPSMVGVDIGCGMETVRIAQQELDLARLDELIRTRIPGGRKIRQTPHELNDQIDLSRLRCAPYVDLERARHSIGTLGGGNHFIEVDRDENGSLYIVVHSGSRHLGTEVADYYQGLTREHETAMPRDLAYVEGQLFEDYIHDMKITQDFAALNRKAMTDVIITGMGLTPVEQFSTIHNYIDTDNMILRKGAVAAYAGQKLLIPINMRDGSLVCVGKGNSEWNCSAPHGAGRLMSRREARSQLSLDAYRAEMAGIYTTCVGQSTLDEAPMAYKSIDEIISHIGPTVDIVRRITPIYNFKAAD